MKVLHSSYFTYFHTIPLISHEVGRITIQRSKAKTNDNLSSQPLSDLVTQ